MKTVQAVKMYHWVDPYTGTLVVRDHYDDVFGMFGQYYKVTFPSAKRKTTKRKK